MSHQRTTLQKKKMAMHSYNPAKHPSLSEFRRHGRKSQTVCDIHRCLLRSPSFFPYFMLVAFEGGGILRALLLLLLCPLLLILNDEMEMRVMIFITFFGKRVRDVERVSRTVLPKFYLENLNLCAYEALDSAGTKAVFTVVPRVMVEAFLKDYLDVDYVVGTELRTVGEFFFTGLVSPSGLLVKHRALEDLFSDERPDVGIGSSNVCDHLFVSLCKEAYFITRDDDEAKMPRSRYPKPLIFHDGRLAFLPTPAATLRMFVWLLAGIPVAILRLFIGSVFPCHLIIPLCAATGMDLRVSGPAHPANTNNKGKGVLYVCSHRILFDPTFLGGALRKPLTAVTYGLSRTTEIISPIKTVRLTRDRKRDRDTMQRLLSEGDLVVCPEGTTCREPYLLRFSSLFAELADEIVPVAVDTEVSMFYGTTTTGRKWLDPILFLASPRPVYSIRILDMVPEQLTCAGGKTSHEVANYIQRELGEALGFECTNLTRRDKHLMMAGNYGKNKN